MASESADPAAPQTEVVNKATVNGTAHINAYVDPALTKRNVAQAEDFVANDQPPLSGSTTLGNIRPVYVTDHLKEIDQDIAEDENGAVAALPQSPNSWQMQTRSGRRYARDPYANGGQDAFNKNAGTGI